MVYFSSLWELSFADRGEDGAVPKLAVFRMLGDWCVSFPRFL